MGRTLSRPQGIVDAATVGQARERTPVALGPYGPEALSYDAVRTVLRDPRFMMPRGLNLVVQGITSGPVWDRVCKLLISLEDAQHQRLRRLVSRAFSPRAVEETRPLCVKAITEIVDRHAAVGHCDVVADIARPYPIPAICSLLGVPAQDWHLFSEWADDISKAFGFNVAEEAPAIVRAWEQLDAYLEDLLVARQDCETDDVLCDLLEVEADGDKLSHEELVNLAALLLNAGTDTTRNQLAAAVQVLVEHPTQWALLAEHPELAPQAVDELIRHSPIVFTTMRKAIEDVELGGVQIPAGTIVFANMASANRDPAVYDDPDLLDITREAPPPLMTFGGGVHYCLGAPLARVQLVEALRVITRRMANPRLTGPTPWKPIIGISGPITVPIEFDPARTLGVG
jgi:cytochrome P450